MRLGANQSEVGFHRHGPLNNGTLGQECGRYSWDRHPWEVLLEAGLVSAQRVLNAEQGMGLGVVSVDLDKGGSKW